MHSFLAPSCTNSPTRFREDPFYLTTQTAVGVGQCPVGFQTSVSEGPDFGESPDTLSGCLWQEQDFALAAVDDAADMVRPERQRGPHLTLVVAAIIDARDTAAVAA